MVSERQRTNIVPNKQTNKSYIPDNQKHTKKHIYLLKNCYLCIISTKCGNDTQTFYNCLRRGFRRGASCICISIKKKAISERYTIKTASRLLQNDIACPADRGGSPTMRTNPGNKMTKRTSRQRTTFFFFFPKHLPAKHRVFVKGEG